MVGKEIFLVKGERIVPYVLPYTAVCRESGESYRTKVLSSCDYKSEPYWRILAFDTEKPRILRKHVSTPTESAIPFPRFLPAL